MKCPNCDAPMTEEQVFCEVCGKERQLVPVFEAEIDETMENAITGIAVDLAGTREIPIIRPERNVITEQTEEEEEEEYEPETDRRSNHRFLLFMIGGVLCVVLLVLLVVSMFHIREQSSYDYHIKKAEEMCRLSDYEQMLDHAESARKIAPNSSDAKMLIARAYEGMNNVRYEKEMLEDLLAVDSAYAPAYDMLIPLYEQENDYQKIADLLSKCSQQNILDRYVDYLASPPQTSQEQGTYEEAIALKLIAPGNGVIYYTLDGSDPTQKKKEYITPILLHSGQYTLKAVYVNGYGVQSTVMQADYYIDEVALAAPVISPEEGIYSEPQYITVEIPDDSYFVYYTTDGSQPGMQSTLYEGAIPMPIGESEFAFVIYDEGGRQGETVYVKYRLDMNITFTGEQASHMLVRTLMTQGIIMDTEGRSADMEGTRQYVAESVISENDQYYYLLEEIYISPDGMRQKTGSRYAVSIVTGECFIAMRNSFGTFDLKRMQ
ncbi:MAG: chitobiase/beta-hexosaminidase C-terminal domain-containing protein [Lachnospiraceae bacterium]|nr:chitobiase/beta-hexosaminidase C-terminal domain-containing protein [Lachnospiraceae bacterium]